MRRSHAAAEEVAVKIKRAELKHSEGIFAYEAMERIVDRTVDEIRAVDSNVNGLLALQAAIYALLIDKWQLFLPVLHWGFIAAIILSAFNILLGRGREVPTPNEFLREIVQNPQGARWKTVRALMQASLSDDRLRRRKRWLFRIALGMTISCAIAAPWLNVIK